METIINSGDDSKPTTVNWVPTPAATNLPLVQGYELLGMVGRGGMGKVYRARHLGLGRIVAIKLLAHEPDDKLLARFREEARAVARLQHPNVAQLFETGLADGKPFYAQEFLEGGSLAQSFAGKPQDPRLAANVVQTVARAIQHSHEHGILHRDLKPANILLGRDGTPKVTDFGLAKRIGSVPSGETPVESGGGLTRTGEIVGTPAYLPPEQASGIVSVVGPASDVYGLGAILYEALTGRPPFQAPDALQTLLMVLSMEPVPPRTLQPKLPRDLETICLKCLEKNPKKRYPTAKDLADDLQRFLNGEPIVARPVGFFERVGKWSRRHKALAALIVVSTLAGMLLAAAGVALAIGYARLQTALAETKEANDQLHQKNAALERANADAHSVNQAALVSMQRLFFETSDKLRNVPNSEKPRREMLRKAQRTAEILDHLRPNDPQILGFLMEADDRLGTIEMGLGNLSTAEGYFARAREIAANLEGRFPGEFIYARNRLLAISKIAAIHSQQRDRKVADELIDSIVPTLLSLAASHPDDLGLMEVESAIRYQLMNRYLRQARWELAETEMRQICALCRRQAKADPTNPGRRLKVVGSDVSFAVMSIDFGKVNEAGPILKQAERDVLALPEQNATPVRKLRAELNATLGTYRERRAEFRAAVDAWAKAHEEYKRLAADHKDVPTFRYLEADALRSLGMVTSMAGDHSTALKRLEDAETMLAKLVSENPGDATFRETYDRLRDLLDRIKGRTPKLDKKP